MRNQTPHLYHDFPCYTYFSSYVRYVRPSHLVLIDPQPLSSTVTKSLSFIFYFFAFLTWLDTKKKVFNKQCSYACFPQLVYVFTLHFSVPQSSLQRNQFKIQIRTFIASLQFNSIKIALIFFFLTCTNP